MKEGLLEYWDSLINDIPHELYVIAMAILIVSSVIFIGIKGVRKGLGYSVGVLLVEYVILIYCSTVVFRSTGKNVTYDFTPFWSYLAYRDGREPKALVENLANVLVFFPVGILLGGIVNRSWLSRLANPSEQQCRDAVKKTWLVTVVVGLGISISIEVLQFVLKRGFSEVDDVMHNTLGCILGYGMYVIIMKICRCSTNYS